MSGNGLLKIPVQDDWKDVAHTKATSLEVKHYYNCNLLLPYTEPDSVTEDQMNKTPLVPSQAYKFRVAAVNGVGIGPWSEPVAFQTLPLGLPTAPDKVRVLKSDGGATLNWDYPADKPDPLEFVVFLSVNPSKDRKPNSNPNESHFQKVYAGSNRQCFVPNVALTNARFDSPVQPAIIFRIACKNEFGYGPATQVRWLQNF